MALIDSKETTPQVAVVIPTFQRIFKLDRCLRSIFNQTYTNYKVYVMCDNFDFNTYNHIKNNYNSNIVKPIVMEKQEFVIGCWNFFTYAFIAGDWSIMQWCVDDVELYSDCLEQAVKCMLDNYSDLDGVIGLAQTCPGHPEYTYKCYGQVLLGRKFIDRYREVDYAVCCPSYKHWYQDEEMHMYASSLGKFKCCKEAILNHYHPAFCRNEEDDTHHIVRKAANTVDRNTHNRRKLAGLVWGKSWEL